MSAVLWLFSAVFILALVYLFTEWYDHCSKDEFKEMIIYLAVAILIIASIIGFDWLVFNIFKNIQ